MVLTLRHELRINNQRLGEASPLEREGIARRSAQGWALARPDPADQLSLPDSDGLFQRTDAQWRAGQEGDVSRVNRRNILLT
ncbi:MAG: hypothetical protein ABI895_43295 [Deltaproteobacteria bacterium]